MALLLCSENPSREPSHIRFGTVFWRMLSLSLNDSLTSLLAYRYSVLHLQEQGRAESQEKRGLVHESNQTNEIEVAVWGIGSL